VSRDRNHKEKKTLVYQSEFDAVAEIIDPVFAKTSPKNSFSVIENEVLGLYSQKLVL
jgi:hypothetical protein